MMDRKKQLMEAIEDIDQKYIEEAMQRNENPKAVWISIAVGVAALLIITTIFAVNGKNKDKVYDPLSGRLLAADTREKNNISYAEAETSIIWKWDQKTVYEKYTSVTVDGNVYYTRGVMTAPENLGDFIGTVEACGYDIYEDKLNTAEADIYQIQGMPEDALVAVNLGIDDEYMVYLKDNLSEPRNLEEFVTRYSLKEAVLFTGYYIEANEYRGITKETSDKIWELLEACKDVPCIIDDNAGMGDNSAKKVIHLAISSDKLGVDNKAFTIRSDGHVWTNMFEYAYCFDITEEIATELIKYINKNNFTAPAPYTLTNKSIPATVVSVDSDYIIINDGLSLKNKAEGREYKVSLDKMTFRRCIDMYDIKAGDAVWFTYDGRIFEDTKDTIENPISICHAQIDADGNVYLLE